MQPLGLIIFMIASIAENKRTPFDLVEGESEIIGYFIEYSGMKFGMFFMAEYIEIVVISGVVTTLFLGGWQIPFLMDGGFAFPWGASFEINEWLVSLMRFGAFLSKVIFLCWFQLMVRWTLPRFRYDQVMRVGWRMLLPLSLLNILVTGIWILY
jgi:NADH-quinone oxidoreductase subunit H